MAIETAEPGTRGLNGRTPVSPGESRPRPSASPSYRQATVARAVAIALWVLVALAAIGGIAGFVALGGRGEEGAATTAAESSTASVAAEGFAELFVLTWLGAGEGDEPKLAEFSAEDISLRGRKPGALRAAWVGTVGSQLVEPGYWSVTVAAEVEEAVAGGYGPAGVHYYRVPVLTQGGALVVAALPAQVPAPALAERPQLAMRPNNPLPPGDLADTLDRFFGAYLAGQGDVERYLRPGADLRAVSPAAFAKTKVTAGEIREVGDSATAVVQVEGVHDSGRVMTTAYTLSLARRDGRWEVDELLAAPPLYRPEVIEKKGEAK